MGVDLLFLGTSSGTPTRARNVTGLALLEETGKEWHLRGYAAPGAAHAAFAA